MIPLWHQPALIRTGQDAVLVRAVITQTAADMLRRTSNRRSILVDDALARAVDVMTALRACSNHAGKIRIRTGEHFVDVNPYDCATDRVRPGPVPTVVARAELVGGAPFVAADPVVPTEKGHVLLAVGASDRTAQRIIELADGRDLTVAAVVELAAAAMNTLENVEDDGHTLVVFPFADEDEPQAGVHYRVCA